jgi:uncharacterized membrane protein YqhA
MQGSRAMIDDMDVEPGSRYQERPAIDTITIVIWTAVGLVLIATPLVMVSLG